MRGYVARSNKSNPVHPYQKSSHLENKRLSLYSLQDYKMTLWLDETGLPWKPLQPPEPALLCTASVGSHPWWHACRVCYWLLPLLQLISLTTTPKHYKTEHHVLGADHSQIGILPDSPFMWALSLAPRQPSGRGQVCGCPAGLFWIGY